MLPMMDDPPRAGDDERVRAALADLGRALDAAEPDDRAFVLDCLEDLARRLRDQGRG
jgi:hypothetical protein